MVKTPLETNVPKIYIYNFFMVFMLTMPIIVPCWQSLGLTMKQIFELQGIYGLCLIVLDLPAGYFADLFGRRTCLIISGILNIITFQILYHSTTFKSLVWFEVSAAVTYAFYMGSDIALLYDSVPSPDGSIIGKKVFYTQLGETIAALLSGLLATISLTLPAQVNQYTSVIPFIIALTLCEPTRVALGRREHKKNFIFIFESLFKRSRYLNLLILFNVVCGFVTYLAAWTYQSSWKELGIPLTYFGFLWAGGNVLTAIFARKASSLKRILSRNGTFITISIAPIIAFLGFGLIRSVTGLLFIVLISLSRALNSVLIQEEINKAIPNKIRATANSFCNLGMRGSFLIIAPFAGQLIDDQGIGNSQIFFGILSILPFLFICLPILRKSNTP